MWLMEFFKIRLAYVMGILLPLALVLAATAAAVAPSRTSITFHVFPAAIGQSACDHPVRLPLATSYPTSTAYNAEQIYFVAAKSEISVGTNLTRNFGGEPDLYGRSWTTEPTTLQSRNGLGLETTDSAEFVAHGTVIDNADITTQEATQWGRFAGEQQETIVPFPQTQIQPNAVTMPDEPLPWSLPTDPNPLPGGN